MDLISSIIYGFIQGATEFLPVSSSGHLALLPSVMKIEDPGVAFDLTMHVGTALSVLVYFRTEVIKLIQQSLQLLTFKKEYFKKNSFALNFLFSTVITVILAFIVKDFAATKGRTAFLIGLNLMVFGAGMYLADRFGKSLEDGQMMGDFCLKKAFLIGFSQAAAVFPGVSRSGITLTTGRLLGLSRTEASRYSFLLSLPIILGGFVLKLPELKSSVSWGPCLLGGVVSFVVGIITIHYFLKVIQKIGLGPFGIYRGILAVLIWVFIH